MDRREKIRENLRAYNERNPIDQFIVQSEVMLDAVDFADKMSGFSSNVLLLGESGVGKEAMAKYIHCQSDRRKGPFIAINCSAIPVNLFESEIFGYEKGGFTGAEKSRPGLLEEAQDGTIFLDEIGELPKEQQPKFLRFLETKNLIRVGGNKVFTSNARIICATNANIHDKISAKEFREDLYFRISTLEIYIPPLRQRRADIIPLCELFLKKLNEQYGLNKKLTPDAIKALKYREWPGNVREIRNVMERMMINSTGEFMSASDINWEKHGFDHHPSSFDSDVQVKRMQPLGSATEALEIQLLQMGVDSGLSSREIAEILEINQSTVVRKLKKYGLKTQ